MSHHLIENTTGTAIALDDMGITVPASATYDMTGKRSDIIALSNDLETNLTSGDIKLIKSEGPTVYYSASQALRILQQDTESILAAGNTGELLCTNPSGDLVWTSVIGGTIVFLNDGSTGNKWLKISEGQAQTSDLAPVVMPFDSVIYALTFVNKIDSTDCDIEIYKNATLLFTWSIVTKRWAYKTDGLSAVTFSAGDRLSVFSSDTGQNPDDPLVTIHYSFLNGTEGNGGGATGV